MGEGAPGVSVGVPGQRHVDLSHDSTILSLSQILHFLPISLIYLKSFDFWPMLKGPKHEIFEVGFFTQIRPVRLDDLGTAEKIWRKNMAFRISFI